MKNPAVDEYIAAAEPFARPVLKKIRAIVHKACPELTVALTGWRAAVGHRIPVRSFVVRPAPEQREEK